jgi:hypothetical protein
MTRTQSLASVRLALIALAVTSLFVVPACADEDEDEEDDENVIIDFSGVEDSIDDLVDEVSGFFDDFDTTLIDVLEAILYDPFKDLLAELVGLLVDAIAGLPEPSENSSVLETHQKVYAVSLVLASPLLVGTGLLYMTGELFGLDYYRQIRVIIPKIVLAAAFGAVSPELLAILIDISEAATEAFRPVDPDLTSTYHFTIGLIIITAINCLVTLGIVVLLVARNGFLLLFVSLSPLAAMLYAFPPLKPYVKPLWGVFTGFLVATPVMMIIVDLSLSMMAGGETIPEWLTTLGMLVLLLAVPLLILRQGTVIVGALSRTATKAVKKAPRTSKTAKRRTTQRPPHSARSRYGVTTGPDYREGMLR